jgi:hypothetical protein
MQLRSINPSTATRFVSSATVFIELTSLETTIMAVLPIGVVIAVQKGPLFTSAETKYIYTSTYAGRLGQQIRSTWKVLKCGTEEGLFGPIM